MVLVAGGAGLFTLYLFQSRTAPFNSDGAANVLQAQAIIGGNPLLRGWWTSDVSFYTTELPEYALVTALRGLTPDVVHRCGALTYTLTVLLTALVARGGAGGQGRARGTGGRAGWCRAGAAAAIMLAPGILGGTEVFLENPDHAGTAVPVLLLLLLLDRAAGHRYTPWAACALLALAQVGDDLTLAVATVPLALVCAVRLVHPRTHGRRGGSRRGDGALLAAAAASVALAQLAGLALRGLGGFDPRPLGGVALAPLSAIPANARLLWQVVVLLFGANQPGSPHQAQAIRAHGLLVGMAGLHVAGLVLAGAGLAAGIAAIARRRADRVTAIAVGAVIALTLAGLCTTVLRSLSNAHEVAVLLPLGAVLAGRALPPLPGRRFRSVAALALSGWLALTAAELGYAAAWPAATSAQQAVAAWLASQHQHAGLAGYWQADATTVTSGGRLRVAPIIIPGAGPGRRASAGAPEADRWESSAAWYQPGRATATFVIAVADPAAPGGGLPVAEVRARFGRPAVQHQIGPDVVLVYHYNLLTRLTATSFPGPG